jgi:hypothetical protein
MRPLASRARHLIDESHTLERQLDLLARQPAPHTTNIYAPDPETSTALLVAIGDNPDRLRNEAAFARLADVAPNPLLVG